MHTFSAIKMIKPGFDGHHDSINKIHIQIGSPFPICYTGCPCAISKLLIDQSRTSDPKRVIVIYQRNFISIIESEIRDLRHLFGCNA
jgi:hypothetical protein